MLKMEFLGFQTFGFLKFKSLFQIGFFFNFLTHLTTFIHNMILGKLTAIVEAENWGKLKEFFVPHESESMEVKSIIELLFSIHTVYLRETIPDTEVAILIPITRRYFSTVYKLYEDDFIFLFFMGQRLWVAGYFFCNFSDDDIRKIQKKAVEVSDDHLRFLANWSYQRGLGKGVKTYLNLANEILENRPDLIAWLHEFGYAGQHVINGLNYDNRDYLKNNNQNASSQPF
jgi:hypothetical protein